MILRRGIAAVLGVALAAVASRLEFTASVGDKIALQTRGDAPPSEEKVIRG